MDSQLLILIIQMITQGVISFLAILVMSKTRAPSWIFIVIGFLFSYVALIFNLLIKLGVISISLSINGLPLVDLLNLLSVVVPGFFFMIGLILKLFRK